MTGEELEIPTALVNQLSQYAQSTPEVEICGLIGSQNGIPTSCFPIKNTSSMPHSRYKMDAQQQISAIRSMRESSQDLFAIYHSHPNSEAYPSERDLNNAAYHTVLYIIISLENERNPKIRGFRISKSKKYREVKLLIK